MPFERPSLAALVERVRSDLRGRLSFEGPLLRRAMADVLGAVWAGAVHMLHGHLEWLALQLFPDKAEREHLLRQASLYGIRPEAASFASGFVVATGTNGSTILAERILLRADQARYRVTEAATIAAGSANVAVEALAAGSAGNVAPLASLSFESPIPGVNAQVTVGSGGIAGGFDQEDTEGVRDLLLLRFREPPQGGADHDYQAWALAVPGVTRAWVYRHENGLGTVVVRFATDGESIFPTPATVAAVQAALNAQRPITAEVTAAAPVPFPVDLQIAISPDTAAVRAAVIAELTDLLFRDAEPGGAGGRGTIRLSRILVAIGVAEGVEDFDLISPTADIVPSVGGLAVVGAATFTGLP